MSTSRRLLRYARSHSALLAGATVSSLLAGLLLVGLVSLTQPFFNEILRLAPAPPSGPGGAPEGKLDALRALRPYLPGERLREWIGGGSAVAEIIAVLIALAFLKAILSYLAGFGIQKAGIRVVRDLRVDLHARLQRQSLRFFSGHSAGELISRVTNDVARIQKAVGADLTDFTRVVFIVLGQAIWVFYLYPGLAFMSLVLLPLIVWPVYQFGRRLRKSSRVSQERMAEVTNLLGESIQGARVVRAFSGEAFEAGRFRGALDRMLRIDHRAARVGAMTSPVMELIGAAAGGALVLYAGLQIQAGRLNPGEFMSFLAGMGWLYASLKRITKVNNEFQQALAAADRVFRLMDQPPEVEERSRARVLAPFRREVRFRDVGFRYRDRPVLAGISLAVPAGSVVALAGSSGSGKTTLVNLLLRFYDVDSGSVEIDGVDIREVTLGSLRRQIGLVTQEVHLFTDTVRSNIAYGAANAPIEGIVEAARAAFADEFIRQLPRGYDTVVGPAGQGLSLGQQQRLSIARAIWRNAPLLILDEATSALDPESERLLDGALANLIRGRTVIVIAHRPATVRRVDRIFVLAEGRIVEEGTHETLLRQGEHYRRLYDLGFRDESLASRA